MKMYRGKASVIVHPSQIENMKVRGWSDKAPTQKPKKVTKQEAD
tara:strand:+ start:2609 stop:2740 length:132 start_codon:yes stop_codon:yes gene_type:complete